MNKVLFVLLSLYALPTADLLAAEVTEATPEQQSTLDLPVEVLDATSMYAKAFKSGDRSFHNAMKELRTAQDVLDSTIQKLTDADGSKRIHLPNDIPSFLRASVIDKTSDVYDMIDRMSLNSHIKEHMKHSVGYYYEVPEDNCATDLEQVILADLQAMAKQYRVLGVIEKNATLNGVQFIVIPDVGNTDAAITNRWKDLDTLFQKHPHLTLVVSFNDDVTQVGNGFCSDPLYWRSILPESIKKLSFTGKKLTTVGNSFFSCAFSLTSVDFKGLSALQTVGDECFRDARALTSVDFRGLSALQTVGFFFFSDASALTSVDFRGLSALQTVGFFFFSGARALTSVNFRGLNALTTVGFFFFSHAHSLTSVDFRGLGALQTVGCGFFSHARSLTRILCHNEQQARLIQWRLKVQLA